MNIRVTALTTGAITLIALGGSATSAQAAVHEARGKAATAWTLSVRTSPGNQTFSGVTATGPADAWAVGSREGTDRHQPLVFRWNGTDWADVALPAISDLTLSSVAASSSDNVWAFGHSLFETGPGGGSMLRALRFDGSGWTVSTIDEDRIVYDVDADGPSDVWLAGTNGMQRPGNLLRWNGTTWNSTTIPGDVYGIDMASAQRGWAVGTSGGQPAAHRWDGQRWQSVATPTYSAPGGVSGQAVLNDVLALSATDVWAVGSLSWMDDEDNEIHQPIAMRWNGSGWTKVEVVATDAGDLSGLVPDGTGGFWVRSGSTTLLRYRAGAWTKVELPTVPDSDTVLSQLTNVPGTETMLGVGVSFPWGAPEDDRSDGIFLTGR
jgi:hypothetical protein